MLVIYNEDGTVTLDFCQNNSEISPFKQGAGAAHMSCIRPCSFPFLYLQPDTACLYTNRYWNRLKL